MPSGTRGRKRAKRESDEEHGMETHLAAKGQAAEATAAENSQTKRRRMEVAQVADPSSLATSSPVPVVASSRRTRARRREAKQSTRDGTTVKVEADEEDARPGEEVLPNLGHQSSQPVAEMPAVRIDASPIVVSDTSTLSAISENSISAEVEELDADTAGRQALRTLPQDNEEMRSATSMPGSGRYSLAEKGKGRASSPQGSPKADVTAQLKADMEGMRADLTKAKATVESQHSLLTRLNETLTCNICLDTLRDPVVLICGHTFCQDDLWNWFHRESASSDDGDDNLESDISDGDDPGSDAFQHDDVPEPSHAGADVPDEQEDISQDDGSEERRSSNSGDSDTVYSGGSDLVPVEDDYNTDDPVDESESSKSPSPVAVRRGVVIRTTRGEQALRRSRLPSRRSPQMREPTHGEPSDAPESEDAIVSPPANAGTARQASTPGRQGRVPPAKRPRRKNLVCPQCRSRVSLPPFPVFAIRSMSDLLAAHTAGRRHESIEAERENNTAIDVTWGGLFPRAASTIGRAVSRRSSSHEYARNSLPSAGRLSSPARHSAHTQNPARPIRDIPIDRLFSDEEDNALSGQPVAGPSHHREDADRLRATNLFRRTRVAQLEREREDRLRDHRRAIRSGSQRGTLTANEASLRANENRAIDAIHRELLLSRVEAPRRNASASRGRDILRHGIRDAEDGVRRCIDCNWEIEDGVCQHCGAVYDSDSEFDDNGDDLEGAATSPQRPPQSQDPSELSFIDRDEYSGRDLDSFADDNGLADEGSQDSSEDTQTTAAGSEGEGEGEIDEERPQQSTSRRRLGGAGSRRKISRFGYDSEDDDEEAGELEEDSEFFVDDNQIEHMDPSDGLLDDEEEAEETDREERRARREERRQAKLARRLRPVEDEDSTSSYASEEDDDESSSEEDDPGLQQSASLTSPSVKGENDVDIPTISSQQVRKEMQEQARRKEATASARDKAARAAISRNARQGQAPDDPRNKASASSSEHAIRRKRIIEASDEE